MPSLYDAHLRHAEHYHSVLWEASEMYDQGGEVVLQSLHWFDDEWNNILSGQSWVAAHADQDDEAAELCNAYAWSGGYLFLLRLHPREQIRWSEAGLDAARRLKKRDDEGIHLGNLSNAYLGLGQTRRAIECYAQHLDIARETGDREGE